MSVLRHAVANDLAIEGVQSGEQGGRAVALVVMRHCAAAAGFQRQTRLRTVESLNLALLIYTEHQRFIRWIQVQADYVDEFLNELRVATDFKRRDVVRPQTMPLPNASHRCFADALRFGHQAGAPVRGVRWLTVQRGLHHGGDFMVGNRRNATWTRRVFLQPFRAQGQKTFAPQLYGGPRDAKSLCDLLTLDAIGGQQNDLRPLNNALRLASGPRPRLQGDALLLGKQDWYSGSAHDRMIYAA